jgi:MraZ protein
MHHGRVSRSQPSPVFTGEYRHTVDEKGRLAIPVRFRAELDQGARVCKWIDGCLSIFPRADWEAFAAQTASLPVSDEGSRTFSRFIFSSAFEIELDRQGRFVLPSVLREFAGLDKEAVVVGARNRLELWSPVRWDQYSAQMDQPEVLAGHLAGLGI